MSEKDRKIKLEYIDEKVALFADKVLLDQKGNVEREGCSRHSSTSHLNRNWAEELDYHANQKNNDEEAEDKKTAEKEYSDKKSPKQSL